MQAFVAELARLIEVLYATCLAHEMDELSSIMGYSLMIRN